MSGNFIGAAIRYTTAPMKITLDLSKLLEQGKITAADAERLKALAAQETSNLGLNILTGFGVIAASAGAVAFLLTAFSFSPLAAVVIGLVTFGLGLALLMLQGEIWRLLSQTLIVIGGLTGAAGLFILDLGSPRVAILVTVIFALTAVLARSSLMAALAVLSLAGSLGARTGYVHAMYSLSIQEPTITIVLFSALALVLYLVFEFRPTTNALRLRRRAPVSCWSISASGSARSGATGCGSIVTGPRTTSPAGRNSQLAARLFRIMCSRSDGRSRWLRSVSGA